jgi:hypothetical protein
MAKRHRKSFSPISTGKIYTLTDVLDICWDVLASKNWHIITDAEGIEKNSTPTSTFIETKLKLLEASGTEYTAKHSGDIQFVITYYKNATRIFETEVDFRAFKDILDFGNGQMIATKDSITNIINILSGYHEYIFNIRSFISTYVTESSNFIGVKNIKNKIAIKIMKILPIVDTSITYYFCLDKHNNFCVFESTDKFEIKFCYIIEAIPIHYNLNSFDTFIENRHLYPDSGNITVLHDVKILKNLGVGS